MPLRRVNGRLFTWCVVCRDEIPDKHKTLRIHLNRSHGMEFLPGCPSCFYYRSRWTDVKKHCERHHQLDVDRYLVDQGVVWGLTCIDGTSTRPTYANVSHGEVCEYPLREERLTVKQLQVVGMAKFVETSAEPCSRRSKCRTRRPSVPQHSTAQPSTLQHSTVESRVKQPRQSQPLVKSEVTVKSHSHSHSRPPRPKEQVPTKQDKQASQQAPSLVTSSPLAKRRKGKPSKRERTEQSVADDVPASLCRPPRASSPCSVSQCSSQPSTPVTPARSHELTDTQSPEQSLLTVSGLSSPSHLSIPALDAGDESMGLADLLQSVTPEAESCQETPGVMQPSVMQPAVVRQQSPSSLDQLTSERPSDGQTVLLLPPHVIVQQPSFDVACQTDLHVEPDDVLIVVPKCGGRLSFQ